MASTQETAAQKNERIVRELFDRWERGFEELCASLEVLTDDCLWVQSGLPDVRGRAEGVAFVQGSRQRLGMETVRVEILKIVADDHSVASERIDYLLRGDGSVIATIPVAGIMDMRDGKIAGWREYFDTGALRPPST